MTGRQIGQANGDGALSNNTDHLVEGQSRDDLTDPRASQYPVNLDNFNTMKRRQHDLERRDASDCSPENERVDIVGAFISVHCFEVHHVSDYLIFTGNPIAAVHVSSHSCNV